MPSDKKFYITTPIYYVNARPHIGHAYSTIVADVIARRHRLLGDDTFFLTGTDEHGQKIERSAAAAGIPPQEFADQVSKTFSDLWKRMGITNDDFIRTTEPRHKQGVQKLFRTLRENGAIYTNTYTGQYCVSDEAYVEVGPGEPCPTCGNITETISESNYYFKLSRYQKPLVDLIESNELLIQPDARRNEVLSFLRGPVAQFQRGEEVRIQKYVAREGDEKQILSQEDLLKRMVSARVEKLSYSALGNPYIADSLNDLSISRTSFKWGIPVPGDESHVIYVWLDALANYMTAVGYGSDAYVDKEKFEQYWPANLHLVGKEIIRFHCVYWPAFLMALRPPDSPLSEVEWNDKWLPKSIVANGWLLFEESKMSKSRGNVVRTETILDAFGTLCPATPHQAPTNPVLLKGTASAVPQAAPIEQAALAAEIPSSPEAPHPPTKQQQDLFATDVLRYFLLREIPFGQDGSFSFDALCGRYNSDLANGYGNLVSRTLSMVSKYRGSAIPVADDEYFLGTLVYDAKADNTTDIDGFLDFLLALNSPQGYCPETNPAYLARELRNLWRLIGETDVHLTHRAPWKIYANEEPGSESELNRILFEAAQVCFLCAGILYAYCPYATAQVWLQLGLGDIEEAARNGKLKNLKWGGLEPGTKLSPLSPIFPRAPKELIQTMIDTEEQNAQAAKPQTSLIDEAAPTAAENHPSTDPAAAPRTSSLPIENPGTHVAGSAAITTERPGTPPHTEAPASAPFANAAAASDIPDTPQIAIDDFVKIDLRVAKIIVAERIPKADKLLRLEVDLGYEKRQILSGIAEWYQPEELVGRNIVVIANLAPRKMRGLESHGMLLAASHGENGKPVLATFGEEILLGSRVR